MARIAIAVWLAILSISLSAGDLTIRNARVVVGPGEASSDLLDIRIRGGQIDAVGPNLASSGIEIDVDGRTVTAGLWNCHVHFTDPRLAQAPQELIDTMLLSRGFTRVVDTGSDPLTTADLRTRIANGMLRGPRILQAGGSFVTRNGTPLYLPGIKLPELLHPESAEPAVAAVMAMGIDGIKIFSGSFQGPSKTAVLPQEIVQAVVSAAHQRNGFVVAHPTDRAGLTSAIEGGVDILAHTAPPAGAWEPELIQSMLKRNIALIPTLKLWIWELERNNVPPAAARAYQAAGEAQLRAYFEAGGEILFGTDTGYMTDFDTGDEFAAMARAGMDADAILAALTVNPARRFTRTSGRIEAGQPGDVVVFAANPWDNLSAFAQPAITIRNGKVIWSKPPG